MRAVRVLPQGAVRTDIPWSIRKSILSRAVWQESFQRGSPHRRRSKAVIPHSATHAAQQQNLPQKTFDSARFARLRLLFTEGS